MIVLGIDPGTAVTGYGLIESQDDDVALITFGALVSATRFSIGKRLNYLYTELLAIISQYQPSAVAVEQPFVAKNIRSALAIGRVQAIALLAAATKEIPSFEYTPTQIKQRVANYGAGSKEQVQEMVRLQLGLTKIPQPNDAADALAAAICHIRETHMSDLLARQ